MGLNVDIITETEEKEPIDTDGILYTDSRGKQHLNYGKFIDAFIAENQCVYANGLFYTPGGAKSVGGVRKDISDSLKEGGWTDKLDVPTNSLLNSIKDTAYIDRFDIDIARIPLNNGEMFVPQNNKWSFYLDTKYNTPYRLGATFTPKPSKTPLLDKWLHDVFEDEDIPTVQEMFGYSLVPITSAQEAFFIVGDGRVGKSVIGIILEHLLGNAYLSIDTKNFVEQRFQIAQAENKLVLYDDDMKDASFESTSLLKKLITADTDIPAERKGRDPYTFRSYAKIIACANTMPSALYDNTNGFFRRIHPIKTKAPDPHRKVIDKFGEKMMAKESEGIFYWALEGLRRLMDNNWKTAWSDRSREFMNDTKVKTLNFPDFVDDALVVGEGDISGKELYQVYKRWCSENCLFAVKPQTLSQWFNDNADNYSFVRSENIVRHGKRVRGYKNLSMAKEWNTTCVL